MQDGAARHALLTHAAAAARRQWTFPLPLPPQLLGIFREGVLKDNDSDTPWAADIEQKVFESTIGPPLTPLPYCHACAYAAAAATAGMVGHACSRLGAWQGLPCALSSAAGKSTQGSDPSRRKLRHRLMATELHCAGAGPYTEVAFLHKASGTLLVTDAVIYVSPEAPEVRLQGVAAAPPGVPQEPWLCLQ